MSTLSKAPLVEAVFTITWGKLPEGVPFPKLGVNSSHFIPIQFGQEDVAFFPINLATELNKKGFSKVEGLPNFIAPHGMIQNLKFLSSEEPSQFFQSGLGIMSIHHLKEKYEWSKFRQLILSGCEAFRLAFQSSFVNGEVFTLDLRYMDGLLLNSDAPLNFLQKEMNVSLKTPDAFHSHPGLEKDIVGSRINFGLWSKEPNGIFVVDLVQGSVPGGPAYILNTTVKSGKNEQISLEPEFLANWLDQAHNLQRFSFESIITSKHAAANFN